MAENVELPVSDTRLYKPLDLPAPRIFLMDEPLLLYNGRIYKLAEEQTGDNYIKVFDSVLGFEEAGSHGEYERAYFEDASNVKVMAEAKKNFIKSLLAGMTRDEIDAFRGSESQILKKLKDHYSAFMAKEEKMQYAGRGSVKQGEGSMFSKLQGYERVLMLDEKLYELLTMKEFLTKFKNAFDPSFFTRLERMAEESEPEQVSKYLTDNVSRIAVDKEEKSALPLVRNKIWHSNRSCKMFFDGVYFVPEFRGSSMVLLDRYRGMHESRAKTEAINEYSLTEV